MRVAVDTVIFVATTSFNSPDWPTTYPLDYAVVDVETTGLTARDRVISVAAVLLDARGAVTGRWASLVDPRRDPGPVHVHGLTAADLAGQPLFGEIADELAGRLAGRVMVAHNASFDWRMLDAEYHRLGRTMPTGERLCTVALAKRLELPLPNWRLESLAAHYGVRQLQAHSAEDDTRVLAEAFRFALHAAARGNVPLPLTRPGTHGVLGVPAQRSAPPRQPCPYVNPGQAHDGALVQGMRVVFTGGMRVPRVILESRAVAAGLGVTRGVSGRTSLLVTNDPGAGTGRHRAARRKGVPMADEATFAAMLTDVRPGVRVTVDAPLPPPSDAAVPEPRSAGDDVPVRVELPRGGVHDLPGAERPGVWTLQASWRWDRPEGEVDVVAFLLGGDERVRGDQDFVSGDQPATPDGTVALEIMGSAEQGITLDLDRIPPDVVRIAIAAVVDEASIFDAVGPMEVQTGPFQAAAHTRTILDGNSDAERVLLLGEFHRHEAGWRFHAQGRGLEFDAVGLARRYGVGVEA